MQFDGQAVLALALCILWLKATDLNARVRLPGKRVNES